MVRRYSEIVTYINGDNYLKRVDYTVICVENMDSGQPCVRCDYSMPVISQDG